MARAYLVRSFLSLLSIVLFLTAVAQRPLLGAPRPAVKPRVVPSVEPGRYTLIWGGGSWEMFLDKDGFYASKCDGGGFEGSWSWSAKSRILVVHETRSGADAGQAWVLWSVKLDEKLQGQASYGEMKEGPSVRLVKVKEKKKE